MERPGPAGVAADGHAPTEDDVSGLLLRVWQRQWRPHLLGDGETPFDAHSAPGGEGTPGFSGKVSFGHAQCTVLKSSACWGVKT